eukprot:13231012-Heterocapsa_arctica.AAC.1
MPPMPGRPTCARREPDLADQDTSDEDEDGFIRPKLGAGNVGFGPPLEVKWAGTFPRRARPLLSRPLVALPTADQQ